MTNMINRRAREVLLPVLVPLVLGIWNVYFHVCIHAVVCILNLKGKKKHTMTTAMNIYYEGLQFFTQIRRLKL